MANIRVKDLPNTSAPAADTDEFIIDSNSAGTRRLNYGELKTAISGDFQSGTTTYKVATLGSDNKLDPAQIPDTLSQGLNFVGVANSASDLTSTTQGDFYVIQTAFGSYNVGDQAVYDGSAYIRVTDGTKEISEGGTGATTLDDAKVNLEIIDVGTAPNEVPLNSMLSGMAYMSPDSVSIASAEIETLEVTDKVSGNLTVNGADPVLTIQDTETSSSSANATLRLAESGAAGSLGSYWDIKANNGALEFNDEWNEGAGTGTRMVIDDAGRVGIGNTSPGSYSASADNLVVGSGSGAEGITIATGAASKGSIYFADATGTGVGNRMGQVYYDHNTNELVFGVNGNERWKLDSTGNLVPLSGVGIDFGSAAAAGRTVESGLLDDFERGTGTPTDASGAGLTLTQLGLNYVKIGSQVTAWVRVTYPTTSDTSTATLGNFPFAFGSSDIDRIGGFVVYQNTGLDVSVLGTNGTGQVTFRNNSGTSYTNAQMSGKIIWFCVTYDVS